MKKTIVLLFSLSLILVFMTACGLLQEVPEPSGTIEAVPLEVESGEATAVPETEEAEAPPAEVDEAEEMAEDATAVEATEVPEATIEAADTPEDGAESESGELVIYTINADESQVRFELDEDLRGARTTVVGTTNQVAGQVGLNLNDLSTAQVGVIQINARTLTTDNNFRNRAINNEILETGAYEFITFTPTAVNGLSDSATIGEEITFAIDGDLTIRDITQPVTFTVTATAVSDTQINGTATAVVNRSDFDLVIPEVPNVANVEEEVELTIDFTATSAS